MWDDEVENMRMDFMVDCLRLTRDIQELKKEVMTTGEMELLVLTLEGNIKFLGGRL